MNGFARGIKKNKRVKQGQAIAFVGKTGVVTAPHLHFEFYIDNKYVDPQGVRFPSIDPLPQKYRAEFQEVVRERVAMLPPWQQQIL